MGYYKDYHLMEIGKWDNGVPFDKYGHALNVDELYDDNSNSVEDKSLATQARQLTSPYGALHYGVGNDDYFIVFDYGFLPDGRVALDSVVNSESGGFIDTFRYAVLPLNEAVKYAEDMLAGALSMIAENGIKNRGWGRTGYQFVSDVKKSAYESTYSK